VSANTSALELWEQAQATYNNGSPVSSENGVGRAIAVNGADQQVDMDDQGHFVVCGVARGRPIHLRYMEGMRFADTTIVVGDTLLHPMEWRPVLPPSRPNSFEPSAIEWNGSISHSRRPGSASRSDSSSRTSRPVF
jgi:hypothetical protein